MVFNHLFNRNTAIFCIILVSFFTAIISANPDTSLINIDSTESDLFEILPDSTLGPALNVQINPLKDSSTASLLTPLITDSAESTKIATVNDSSLITVDGIVLDEQSGELPDDTTLIVSLENLMIRPDSSGSFKFLVQQKDFYIIKTESIKYGYTSQTINAIKDKQNYFVTILVNEKKKTIAPSLALIVDTADIPWTISGTIIDSRFDLAIESDSTIITFDKDTLLNTSKGAFKVKTNISGDHTFSLKIPGYHDVVKTVHLVENEKQFFIVIPTTVLSHAIKRREITVSARAQDVHTTANVSKVTISRKELTRTAATVNDPIRVIQTLPGVASQSDISARPIVRGGDVHETRIFLDGIPLLEPYHFGGLKSIFNQEAVENLSFYKAGFPSEFRNAQSSIIDVTYRTPVNEPLSLEFDLNPLQYSSYLGIPLFKNKAGLNFSAQGSFFDFIGTKVMKVVSNLTDDPDLEQIAKVWSFPDYQDFSAGFALKPNDKLLFKINDIYNTDKVKFISGTTMVNTTYYYDFNNDNQYDSTYVLTRPVADTGYNYYSYPDYYYEDRSQYPYDRSSTPVKHTNSKPFFEADTLVHYRSSYNVLYGTGQYIPDENSIFNFALAWQKRWWDLYFPESNSFQSRGSGFSTDQLLFKSIYDVDLNVYNFNAGWRYTGIENHLIKAGIQIDYLKSSFNVLTYRIIHEFISRGSTNINDFWGPINGDSAINFDSLYQGINGVENNVFVSYTGKRKYYDGSFYLHDTWEATPRLTINGGFRIEHSRADTSTTFSPRLSVNYNINKKNELVGSIDHYTQNNYSIAALALSKDLKPEKTWHASLKTESKILPWLTQGIELYGKYYYDLMSEIILPDTQLPYINYLYNIAYRHGIYNYSDYSETELLLLLQNRLTPQEIEKEYHESLNRSMRYRSSFTNNGKGYSYGFEYFLRFEPSDFWHGWLSLSLGHSMRQRAPGWRWHQFPLDRPLLISFVNYYRLPRRYELSVKYRYMSGLPYTSLTDTDSGTIVGNFNDSRYKAYHKLDLKIAKGFSIKEAKGHFYFEIWSAMNSPNMFQLDSKTNNFKTMSTNLPATALFVGVDCSY